MGQRTTFCIIGGGIVGLATALSIVRRAPNASIRILEKEPALATHQTGNNSGVVHAGVYYQPGSLKAKFCRSGGGAIEEFCNQYGIGFERRGKLIVATTMLEVERLAELNARCIANGLTPNLVDRSQLRDLEPHISGLAALQIAASAITDFPAITRKIAEIINGACGEIVLNAEVKDIHETASGVIITTGSNEYYCDHLVVCGGLNADRLARMCGIDVDFQIAPFRGEYFDLSNARADIVHHMIYPVPDPELPFLGIHLTPMIDGRVTVGPNAVLALAREGYSWGDVSIRDLRELIFFKGFRTLARQNWRSGLAEFRNSIFKDHYLEQCQKYCPSLTLADLNRRSAGVRAQAILADGTMVHDFLLRETRRTLHICNAPSPAATSSFAIGEHIADRLLSENAHKESSIANV